MSTTFGILIDDEFVEVAFRSSNRISIKNPLVMLLPEDIILENDNSPQGIVTTGDLQRKIKNQ